MAAARRLSELLQEQQEPFLLDAAYRTRRGIRSCCHRLLSLCNHGLKKRRTGGLRSALSKVLCGRAVRRVLRWEDLAGGCGGREFRRLRRYSSQCAMEFGERVRWKDDDVEVDSSSRQLSPVSVLERRSDDDSPVHSPRDDDDEEKPSSTSGSSPPSDAFLGPASPCFSYNLDDKFCDMDVDETVGSNRAGSIEEQISSWEKMAGDISRIPSMMEHGVHQSMPQWREHRRRPEVAEIGARIETLVFEDIRTEAVCDMLDWHCRALLATPTLSPR